MKWLFCGAGILLLAALVLAGCSKLRGNTSDAVDGGVVKHNNGDDAPKVIESTEIRSFRCVSSQLAVSDPGELGHHVHTFEAERKENKVVCTWQWYGTESGQITFEADDSFLNALQKIVSEYDLAQYNGFYHSVSGLPDMFGDNLSIEYVSGEQIYAGNNQSGFLPMDAVYDVYTLFGETSGKILAPLTLTQSSETFFDRENNRLIHTAYPTLSLSDEEQEKYPQLHDAVQTFNENLRTEYKTKLLRLRQAAQTVDGNFPELYANNELFVTRSDSRILSFYEKREEFEGWLDTQYYWDAHTFDVKTGRELRFEDVFAITDELSELLFLEMQDAYPELTFAEESQEIIAEEIRDNNTAVVCFSLAHDCVHVFFTDFRFTGQHTGGQHITLSFDDYPQLFQPEWKTVSHRQMLRLDRNVNYPLADGNVLRMEFTPAEGGFEGEWLCSVKDFFGKKQEYRETFLNAPFDVYLIRQNGRKFLYLDVPTGDISAKTNIYEITRDGISFLGQTDTVMYETVTLDPDRLRMMRLDDTGKEDMPVPVYGVYKVGNDGMPVWIETIEQ